MQEELKYFLFQLKDQSLYLLFFQSEYDEMYAQILSINFKNEKFFNDYFQLLNYCCEFIPKFVENIDKMAVFIEMENKFHITKFISNSLSKLIFN
jgi:hypothetical protein